MRDKNGRFIKGHAMPKEWCDMISKTITGTPKGKVYFGEESSHWKGDKVGYRGIHSWIDKQLGKPMQCERCGTTNETRYEWSNNSGEYKRDRNDWERLCVRCHRLKDDWVNKVVKKNITEVINL